MNCVCVCAHAGEQVGFLLDGTESTWLSCDNATCELNRCPGKKLRENDKQECPQNTFTIHRIDTTQKIISAGDRVVLEQGSNVGLLSHDPDSGVTAAPLPTREFISCDFQTFHCHLSSECVTEDNAFDHTHCYRNILIVRAEGKRDGEAIEHRDLIRFEFEADADSTFNEKCGLSCEQDSPRVCSKKRCVAADFNTIGGLTGPDETCGEVFCVKKFL